MRNCEITKRCTSMNSIKGTHEFTKGKLERHTRGAWKDRALGGQLEIHATAALL